MDLYHKHGAEAIFFVRVPWPSLAGGQKRGRMKLICPSTNWKNPIEIDSSFLPVLKEVAKRLNLAFNHNATQGKVYLGSEQKSLVAHFVSRLKTHTVANIIDGVLMLDGREYKACSGAPGAQIYGQYFSPGAPIPPGDYEIDLAGYYLDTPGIEGIYYHIVPDPIYSADGSKKRTEIGLHRDSGSPGTAGCIGVVGADFDRLDLVLKKLAKTQKRLALKVSYICQD